MIRTLIFGAIAGYVGKKLYDEGKLTEFKDDLVSRYNQARGDLSARSTGTQSGTSSSTNGLESASTPAMPRGSSTTGYTPSPSIS
ncbi:hypothetical protein [Sphingobium mellinum]|uniref:hypothetical protein n=1 Tax=Sphingobium mellinum TaxID=1387166 RepID=UPI0030EC873B